jgi:hypothetical protein
MPLIATLAAFALLLTSVVWLRRHARRSVLRSIAADNPGARRELPVLAWVLSWPGGRGVQLVVGATESADPAAAGILFVEPDGALLSCRRLGVLGFTLGPLSGPPAVSLRLTPSESTVVSLVLVNGDWRVAVSTADTSLQLVPWDGPGKHHERTLELRAAIEQALGREPCALAVGELGSATRWRRQAMALVALAGPSGLAIFFMESWPFSVGRHLVEATYALVVAGAALALVRSLRSSGRVELGARGIDVYRANVRTALQLLAAYGRSPPQTTILWSEIKGYRDDSADYVALARGGNLDVNVPTPTEADRTALLAFLDGRGLARIER